MTRRLAMLILRLAFWLVAKLGLTPIITGWAKHPDSDLMRHEQWEMKAGTIEFREKE
jgi:hypothetical protein